MKKLIAILGLTFLVGCSGFYPPKHDTALFHDMIKIDIMIEDVNCTPEPNAVAMKSDTGETLQVFYHARYDWGAIKRELRVLVRYADWRSDPQLENIEGMYRNADKLSQHGEIKSKAFCELSKKVARERIKALRKAWEGR